MHAFVDRQWIDAQQAAVSIFDAGFVQGVAVAEQMRTFKGKVFRLEEHLERFEQGLKELEIDLKVGRLKFKEVIEEAVRRNQSEVPEGSDLGVGLVATPGWFPSFAQGKTVTPWWAVYAFPLAFPRWSAKYDQGQTLAAVDVPLPSPASVPLTFKCRSRVHYYLADRQAARLAPGAWAVLCDEQGFVRETSSANVVGVRKVGGNVQLVAPPRESALPGITWGATREWAARLGWSVVEEDFTREDLVAFDEVWLTSTPWCVLPVVKLVGRKAGQGDQTPREELIGDGRPGPVYREMLTAWNAMVGLDVAEQARNQGGRLHGV